MNLLLQKENEPEHKKTQQAPASLRVPAAGGGGTLSSRGRGPCGCLGREACSPRAVGTGGRNALEALLALYGEGNDKCKALPGTLGERRLAYLTSSLVLA